MEEIAIRRRQYLERVLEEFNESSMSEYDSRLWAINHSRLILGQDVDRANRYFETVALDPRPVEWKDGKIDTADWDFMGVKLLKTLLDFDHSSLLSKQAKNHLKSIFTKWKQPRHTANKDNYLVSRWPFIHTENHDIMCLTIGLFGELFAGRDVSEHIKQLSQSLAWRFERGWVEWNSPCYQIHYLNPLLILSRHAPSSSLRKGASDLINLQMAERALLSVNGFLGGPFSRGYDRHIEDDRYDSYLPVMWIAFGLGDSRLTLEEGVQFAADSFEPDPIIYTLSAEAATRPVLHYKGSRPTVDQDSRGLIYYHNTPHVSMGSWKAFGYDRQARFFNVMFAADPSKSLRTYMRDLEFHSVWDQRNERGELVQHKNWLISRGTLVEEGGIRAKKVNKCDLYRIGKGLCAHFELADNLHVFQVSDLATYSNERTFLAALSMPKKVGDRVRGKTTEGKQISVELADMSLSVNGNSSEDWGDMLHDCLPMYSRYGSGQIEIRTDQGALILDNRALLANVGGYDEENPLSEGKGSNNCPPPRHKRAKNSCPCLQAKPGQ